MSTQVITPKPVVGSPEASKAILGVMDAVGDAVGQEITLAQRFGTGRYFAVQCEMFKDTQRIFNIPEDKAEKIAKAFATSLGAIMSKSQVTFKGLDKLNKDGGLKSLSEISKVKDLPLTNEIAMLRAISYVNGAKQNHVKVVATLDDTLTDWVKGL